MKHYYLKNYIDAFTTAMRKRWRGELYYIDLFAGPGRCRVRETEEEIHASPLLALGSKFPFAKYFFVDLDKEVLKALSKRCGSHPLYERIYFMEGDCNKKIDEIINIIPVRSLSLAFIDPTGLHFFFTSMKKLAERKIDVIITFPKGMAIDRNIKKFLKQELSPLDKWMGDKGWRDLYRKKLRGQIDEIVERGIIGRYRENLEKLGYYKVKLGNEVLISSSAKKLPLYYILFASKDVFGYKLWQKVGKIEYDGQRKLL